MELFVEWCSKVNRRKGVMLPVDKIPLLEAQGDSGFRSVFMFNGETAVAVSTAGSSQGLKNHTQYSDTLFLDLDDGEKTLPLAIEWANKNKYQARIYTSGGKGFHLHLPIQLMEGISVAYSQLRYTLDCIPFPLDYSLYRASSLIALTGRVHPKTKRKKELVSVLDHGGEAKELVIPVIPLPPTVKVFDPSRLTGEEFQDSQSIINITLRIQELVMNPPSIGNRHMSLWKLGRLMAETGWSETTVYEIFERINETWPSQKTTEELINVLKGSFRT